MLISDLAIKSIKMSPKLTSFGRNKKTPSIYEKEVQSFPWDIQFFKM